ncbi:MAG: NADH-quinone oxidoreductase subunit C [Bauldia sp.]|nr:NADH-quinone oxidoreductase subunit C [Bauldia sp.]
MANIDALIGKGRPVEGHRPWPRAVVSAEVWRDAIGLLAAGERTLLGLWGEARAVHMALLDEAAGSLAVISLDCTDGRFPSVAETHPPAIRPERAIRDLFGLEPVGLADERQWLDHGRWGVAHPLGEMEQGGEVQPYAFLKSEGESLHQIPVGPVHAGIIEPGHFRFTASGETVVRLEERLGYVHKGIEGLMAGADIQKAARLAGRTSGDSTVAYAYAFARAIEAALGIEAPPRAAWLRALMAELERLANHFGDIGAICNDASFSLMHAHCGVLRERVLRAAGAAFGHRLMMDAIVPGGVAVDLNDRSGVAIRALVAEIRDTFPRLVELYDNTASLQDRTVGTGVLRPELARRFGAGGYVGRASGRGFDARKALPYAPYDRLAFEVPVLDEGDVNARVWIRIREVEQSLAICAALTNPPAGRLRVEVPARAGEAIALVEGFRGDVLAWLRLDENGRVARCHLRDPSWFQWPLLEAAIEGNIVADFPLCNKSFNCSYSGHDL